MLLNARRCECLYRDLALLLFVGEGFGELSEDNSSSVGASESSGMAGFFPLSRTVGFFACPLSCVPPLPRQVFSLPGPEHDIFHVAGAQRNFAIPSFSLLVPPASSPYLDANEGIGLQATESPDYLTLQLCQMNQMWGAVTPQNIP